MQNTSSLSAIKLVLIMLMIMLSMTDLYAYQIEQISTPQTDTDAPVLVGTDSKFFADIDTSNQLLYVMVSDEFWSYDLNNEQWELLHVFEEEELNGVLSEPKQFGYDYVSGDILLWSTGVGIVYRLDLDSFDIQRIDQSFSHKNQFNHIPFFREGKIHAFGGYGFWEDKNLISFFAPEIHEWLIVSPAEESDYPPERVGGYGTYIKDQDAFYAYGGSTITNRNHDGSNAIRASNGEIWKFEFQTMSWSKVMNPGPLPGMGFPSVGINNVYGKGRSTLALTPYSKTSGNWYIPFRMRGGDMANVYLKPYDLSNYSEYKPVEIDLVAENAMISTHFLFDQKAQEMVFVGFRNVTNDEAHPLMILKVPESEMLSKLEPEENGYTLIYGSLLGLGLFLISGWIYFRYFGSIPVINGGRADIKREELEEELNSVEQTLLKGLIETDHMPETSELEEMVWPEVENYDYRRKLRNETIRSINEKAMEKFGIQEELIIRQKDKEDNRRFRYGINPELIN